MEENVDDLTNENLALYQKIGGIYQQNQVKQIEKIRKT